MSQDDESPPTNRLHINKIPPHYEESDLRAVLSQYGPVKSVRLVKDMGGKSIGFAVVDMDNVHDANELLATEDRIDGKVLEIWRPPSQLEGREPIIQGPRTKSALPGLLKQFGYDVHTDGSSKPDPASR